jgi:integrase
MAHIQLKGLNSKKKKLADSSVVTYHYAWKGGPRLTGKLGSPEFIASYHEAVTAKKAVPVGLLLSLMQTYQGSAEFTGLRDRTRLDYVKQIKLIEKQFGDFPLTALSSRGTRAVFMGWRDELARKSRRQADYAWTVLARVLSWSKNRGLISDNPCERGGRLYKGNRKEHVWTAEDEAAFYASAPAHLHLPVLMALWTGQRQGDLLRLTWTAYDGRRIRLKQRKTDAHVTIPVGAPLKAALDASASERLSPIILLTTDGTPWTEDGFRSSFAKARIKAGILDVTFNDLRGTAVTRLALAGATEAEIATVTGHALRDVRSILDSNYLDRDPALGENAIRKLEKGTKVPD